MERHPLKRWIALGGVLVLVAGFALALASRHHGGRTPLGIGAVRAPANTRIRVQVLNASRTRGLARRATMHLRDRGFDVVEMGTDRLSLDSTLVLDRSGHPEWAQLVARALGGARVEARPDSSRYLDVTVLLGAAWRPPAEPFYP